MRFGAFWDSEFCSALRNLYLKPGQGLPAVLVEDFLPLLVLGERNVCGVRTFCTTYAVVTGANKGIGYGICKKLASRGVMVVLTARNEKRGLDAVESLKELGLPDFVVFHQLDVSNPTSVFSLAEYMKVQFGKLDILVSVPGGIVNGENVLKNKRGEISEWNTVVQQNYKSAKECVETNFFGAEKVTEALLPLLQLSASPRIVIVSARIFGQLKYMPNDWVTLKALQMKNLVKCLESFLKITKKEHWKPILAIQWQKQL
ncbi:(+)-neomenthol dehydrogenase [Trifolium repens]|nr:(+)-neomenthol dehydrogenase [Trifolium repens]